MDKYFDVSLKNHKKNNKKILCMSYKHTEFSLDKKQRTELIEGYIEEVIKHKELVVIMDFRNINKWDKKSIWEGASDIKKKEEIAIKHIDKVFLVASNKLLSNLLTIVLKIIKNKIETKCVSDLSTAISNI